MRMSLPTRLPLLFLLLLVSTSTIAEASIVGTVFNPFTFAKVEIPYNGVFMLIYPNGTAIPNQTIYCDGGKCHVFFYDTKSKLLYVYLGEMYNASYVHEIARDCFAVKGNWNLGGIRCAYSRMEYIG